MIIRMFDTAINPEDVDRAKQIFVEQVRPAFEAFDGCHGIDMFLGLAEHSGGFVDVAAISRWDSEAHIRAAVDSSPYETAMSDMKSLFEQNPIVRHFEAVE
jgi:heme-degrading monooxygenase HmoA